MECYSQRRLAERATRDECWPRRVAESSQREIRQDSLPPRAAHRQSFQTGGRMSTASLQSADWPEIEISRAEQFKILDTSAREIEEISRSTWVELADLCTTMRDNELWKEGHYHSFHDWLRSA